MLIQGEIIPISQLLCKALAVTGRATDIESRAYSHPDMGRFPSLFPLGSEAETAEVIGNSSDTLPHRELMALW